MKTEAEAGDKDVPPNPAALEQLRQVPTVSFQGQEYPLTLIGDAFAACLDDYYQKLLNEGLCFLIGAHGQLEWQEIGKRRLRNLARIAEEESADRLPPGVPLGLLPAWAERCAQNDLPARFPICFQSLLQFRIHDFRNQVFVLVRVPAQQPYRTLFNEAADWVELVRPAFWRRHHPEVHAVFRAERARLYATGMDYMDAMKQAEETIAAERRARGLRE